MRRNLKPLAVLLATCALFSAASADRHGTPKEIAEAYAKFQNAFRWNSPVALRNLVYDYSTPDFTSNYGGLRGDLYMEVENVIQMGRMVEKVRRADLAITGVAIHGQTCQVTVRMNGQFIGQMGGKRQLVTMNMLSRDTWIKTTAGWKIKHSHGLSQSMTTKPYSGKRGR
ncbi:MAG TPA: hypothetical protein PLL78_07030 [Fimbriimonadaceae bacterium]|nr:hypothetical protein [Fimbriimonadaceae bacterium]HRJ96424.1 hypothetical protein [Fimbriimonadaceae bacterium]